MYPFCSPRVGSGVGSAFGAAAAGFGVSSDCPEDSDEVPEHSRVRHN